MLNSSARSSSSPSTRARARETRINARSRRVGARRRYAATRFPVDTSASSSRPRPNRACVRRCGRDARRAGDHRTSGTAGAASAQAGRLLGNGSSARINPIRSAPSWTVDQP
ncbi:hypothetical protein [Streptomyces sp. NBC_01483]|uniref:hypothetical protein n=1 Tax=Streptomyces sp. NBC_01483 TaxID=2903883 RepID=UPI002E2EB33C|nr:hypothetical protein [Streptomyces sp. NBC_01483]